MTYINTSSDKYQNIIVKQSYLESTLYGSKAIPL
jgi:hypothetical protein